jgi:hypothetical protein
MRDISFKLSAADAAAAEADAEEAQNGAGTALEASAAAPLPGAARTPMQQALAPSSRPSYSGRQQRHPSPAEAPAPARPSPAASSALAAAGFGVDVVAQVAASVAAVHRHADAQVATIVRTDGDARVQTVKIVVANQTVLDEVRAHPFCLRALVV